MYPPPATCPLPALARPSHGEGNGCDAFYFCGRSTIRVELLRPLPRAVHGEVARTAGNRWVWADLHLVSPLDISRPLSPCRPESTPPLRGVETSLSPSFSLIIYIQLPKSPTGVPGSHENAPPQYYRRALLGTGLLQGPKGEAFCYQRGTPEDWVIAPTPPPESRVRVQDRPASELQP